MGLDFQSNGRVFGGLPGLGRVRGVSAPIYTPNRLQPALIVCRVGISRSSVDRVMAKRAKFYGKREIIPRYGHWRFQRP
jgi:hypothetical protein